MLVTIRHLLSLIRFSHTVFALPFAILSAFLAWQLPDSPFQWLHLWGILICMVGARSAAMAFNRLLDWRIDAANPRTAGRHLPAGLLSGQTVIGFTIASSMLFLAGTLLFLPNRWPLILALPVLAFLLGYSYAKRLTVWCHYWLSTALMLSPIAAWIAIRGTIEPTPIALAAVIFFWVGGFDILYACQDADYDRETKLFSLPARWGIPASLRIAAISHALTVVALCVLGQVAGLGAIYFTGVVAIALLLAYEHWLVRPDDLSRVNLAFFNVNAFISLGLLLIGIVDKLAHVG